MLLILICIIFVGVVIFYAINEYIYNAKQADDNESNASITTYEECVDAGYPVIDTYPNSCKLSKDKIFVQRLPSHELKAATSDVLFAGQLVCLPHWVTEGEQTLECAIGFKRNSGEYYGLTTLNYTGPRLGTFPLNSQIELKGSLSPGSMEKYNTRGVIEIKEINELE